MTTMPRRVNVYTCMECKGLTVTVGEDDGVTPMFMVCRAGGGMCWGLAKSTTYPPGSAPSGIPAPSWVWRRPRDGQPRADHDVLVLHPIDAGL